MDSENKSESPAAAVIHHLPQLPTWGRSMRTVQSKSSSKWRLDNSDQEEETVLHIEGTSKVIKISNDGISQLTEIKARETEESFAPSETCAFIKQGSFDSKIAVTPNESSVLTLKQNSIDSRLNETSSQQDIVSITESLDEGKDITSQHSPPFNKSSYLLKSKRAVRGNKQFYRKVSPQKNKLKSPSSASPAITKHSDSSQALETIHASATDDLTVAKNVTDDKVNTLTPHLPRQVLIFPGELPSEEQVEKMKASCRETSSLQNLILLAEGDMRWAKVTGHPYWPCMVSKCPFSQLLTRVKGKCTCVIDKIWQESQIKYI